MRISTQQIYSQGMQAFSAQQTKLARLQQEISTGVKLQKPSDDPVGSQRVLELEETISLNIQYQENIGLAEQRLAQQDGTLGSVENLLLRVRELAIQANNSSMDENSHNAIVGEVNERFLELLSLANSVDYNGDYLFAGYQIDSQPFTMNTTGTITHVDFNGDEGRRSLQISRSRQMDVDTSGIDLFMRIESAIALNEFTPATNVGSAVMAPAYVHDVENYLPDTYQIVFDTVSSVPDTTYNVLDSLGTTVASGVYAAGEDIEFMGIATSIVGAPANGDSFSLSPGQYQDIFSIVRSLVLGLQNGPGNGATAGSYTFGSAVTVFDYSVETASFEIDGNLVSLNANYVDLDGLTTEIQNQLDVAVGGGNYLLTNDGSTIMVERLATGPGSTAPVLAAFNGDVDGNGFPATPGRATTTAGVSVTDYGVGNNISFDVDGFAVVLDTDYLSLAGVTTEIQADLDATAGPGVYSVSDNGTDITIAKLATGIASTAPVINNPGGAGVNQAEFTGAATTNGVAAINTVTDYISGGIAVNGLASTVLNSNIAQSLTDIDNAFNKLLSDRTSIGGRLNALDTQKEDNESHVLALRKSIGLLRDTDLAEAISQLTLEQTTLDAAQAVFARITGTSLFDFLR